MKILNNISVLMLSLLIVNPIIAAEPNAKPAMDAMKNNDESKIYNLKLTINSPETNIKQGDEIPIVFTITNQDESAYFYTGRNGDRSGRMWEYKLTAKYEDGFAVPDPRENYREGMGGGLSSGNGEIKTGQSFTQTIPLNRWARINKPGRYTVTGIYHYSVLDPNVVQKPGIRYMKDVPVASEPIEITIEPRSPSQMGQYIHSLSKELKDIKPSNSAEEERAQEQKEDIMLKLMYTCDKRIVPVLIDQMYDEDSSFWVSEAFQCYLPSDPEIKNAVLEVMKKKGLPRLSDQSLLHIGLTDSEFKELILLSLKSKNRDILVSGALAAQEHHDDSLIPLLVAIAQDINSPARPQAICELANSPDELSLRTLNLLLKDKDRDTRNTALRAIEGLKPAGWDKWGQEVSGLQCRLRPYRYTWNFGKKPVFGLELRNNGETEFNLVPVTQENCEIEIDGQWYGWKSPPLTEFEKTLKPKSELYVTIMIKPADSPAFPIENLELKRKTSSISSQGKPLEFPLGKHTIRVRYRPNDWLDSNQSVLSNPVEINILPKPPAFPDETLNRAFDIGCSIVIVKILSIQPEEKNGHINFYRRKAEIVQPVILGDLTEQDIKGYLDMSWVARDGNDFKIGSQYAIFINKKAPGYIDWVFRDDIIKLNPDDEKEVDSFVRSVIRAYENAVSR